MKGSRGPLLRTWQTSMWKTLHALFIWGARKYMIPFLYLSWIKNYVTYMNIWTVQSGLCLISLQLHTSKAVLFFQFPRLRLHAGNSKYFKSWKGVNKKMDSKDTTDTIVDLQRFFRFTLQLLTPPAIYLWQNIHSFQLRTATETWNFVVQHYSTQHISRNNLKVHNNYPCICALDLWPPQLLNYICFFPLMYNH